MRGLLEADKDNSHANVKLKISITPAASSLQCYPQLSASYVYGYAVDGSCLTYTYATMLVLTNQLLLSSLASDFPVCVFVEQCIEVLSPASPVYGYAVDGSCLLV